MLSRASENSKNWKLKQDLNSNKSFIREIIAEAHPESRPYLKAYSWIAAFVFHASMRPSPWAKQGWMFKQGLNHAKSRIREHGREVGAQAGIKLYQVAHRGSRGGRLNKG